MQCLDGSCVGAPRVCDGVADCAGGEDEVGCPANKTVAACPAGYLSCSDGSCYNGRFYCNKTSPCPFDEDEPNCRDDFIIPEIHEVRLRCSQYYRELVDLVDQPVFANVSLEVEGDCPHFDKGTYIETSFMNPLCLDIVTCDFYGCYTDYLTRYTEYFDEINMLCASCDDGSENCWLPHWLDEYETGKLSNISLYLMLKRSEIPDFSDIADLYTVPQEERLNNSIPANDFIYSCTFDNRRCNHTHFYTWMSDEYGTCYTFNSLFKENSSKVQTTKRAGPKTGLKVALDVQMGVALLTPEVGVRVIVHDPYLLPALDEEGFSIGPGASSVAVKRTKYVRLGEPHGVCANDYGFNHPYKYSRKLCKQLCVEREFRERCGCYIGQNPLYDSLQTVPERRCSSVDRIEGLCIASVTKSIEEDTILCDCPLPCSEMKYDTQVTTSKTNNVYYNILSQTRKPLKSICTNDSQMVSLLVYLDSKSYQVTEESPAYSWDTLLSNIGGSLGLFVGVSLISILEVIEMIIDVIFAGFKRCTGGGKRVSRVSAKAWGGKNRCC
ncbi:acid-sensing ion channel 2-like [Penaeus chinensis]|uniref:acid-sensing ion channel 2-like n=1 Tax=Penaeus chinensis TaxID=139456 RepID=UPI001FB69002|nr:acid-sensing ion channel 2-like [Penaeus chinensis]